MDLPLPSAAGCRRLPAPARRFSSTAVFAPALAAIAATALVLGGCSMFSKDKTDLACPKVGILSDAAKVTLFRPGSGNGQTDVVAHAVVGDYTGSCTYDETGVTIDISLALVAERGPALTGTQIPLSYFVAISKPDGSIATKQVFATTVDFPGNAPRAGSREGLQPHIPLPKGQDARGYGVLVGFQLTPDQLAYNRKTATR
jgi:hypothetical protein